MGASKVGVCLSVLLGTTAAHAFVSTPVGGRPGELDVNAQVTTERGKIEPNENQASFTKSKDWYEYKLGVGYTWGDVGPLQFFSTRLEATYYRTPAHTNDPDKWQIGPAGSSALGTIGPECTAGAKYLGGGVCEFYPKDDGTLVSATVSAALVHDADYAFGLYLKGTVPFGMNKEKFANPRLDYFAAGWQGGVELTNWFGYEANFYFGLGTRPFGTEQNGAVALTNLLHFHARQWLLPWKAGIKLGPYMEGDLHERFDERFDRAYSPQVLPQPGATPTQYRDRIRAARFALAVLPYFLVTEHLSVELGYVQKFFGYDARATQAYFVGLRGLIDLGN
ncbi:MAG: hypothetical protein KC776_14655 [Myxococcales bacterium]|nr:hypothetical protein [Myxococcales bacterium]MCB9579863.1 hypothetical protein [Polyangiaceae bacterium]